MNYETFIDIIYEFPLLLLLIHSNDSNLFIGMLLIMVFSEKIKNIKICSLEKKNEDIEYPSINLSTITFYVIYQYSQKGNKDYFILIFLLGFISLYKNYNNLIQLLSGFIFGSFYSYLYI